MAILDIHKAQLEYAKTQPWFPAFVYHFLTDPDTDVIFEHIGGNQSIVDSFHWLDKYGIIDWGAIDACLLALDQTTSREDLKAYLLPYKQSNPEWFI